ncbi:MAG: ABC transporter permease [Anaerolineales bacterium]
MNIWQTFLEALESLTANKMRSGLTVLGIVIGVAAVIAMLGIGTGAEASITGQIDSIGTNLLYVSQGGEASNPEPLTLEDAEAISDPLLAPSVLHVAPILQGQSEVTITGENTITSLVGVTSDYFSTQDVSLAEGELISEVHLNGQASVVLLGSGVAETLFDRTSDLIGETVRIDGQPFRVIGVMEEAGGTGFGSADDQVLVPLTTAQVRLLQRDNPEQVDMIYVQAVSAEAVPSATDEVSQILRSRHLSTLGEDDFEILSTQSLLDTASMITSILTIFLGGVAGISLLVGGIGIMNIMLVTVIERTKEIGLRKALGARKLDILTQFMVESSMLSLGGGVIGILLGYGIAALVGQVASMSDVPITPVIELNAILLATLFSAAIGLFFGLYPANRAARLEPVEALRSE